ncbi:MAG: ADP-ribosylglycohydrolase family protein, partial [bacterium]
MPTHDQHNRSRASLLGAVVGDALGVPVEFSSREERRRDPVLGMRAYGTHHQPAGTWSDDSSMLLCLAASIVETGWNLEDQMSRYAKWLTEAYMTPHGKVFDVGGATRAAIGRYEEGTQAVLCGGRDERDNGNGSLMRCLPAALYFAASPDEMLARAMDQSSRLTHAHPRSRLACVFFGFLVSELMRRTGTEHPVGTEDDFPDAEHAGAAPEPAVTAAPASNTAVNALAAASRRLKTLAVSGSLSEELAGEVTSLSRLRSGLLHTRPERE